MLRSRLFLEFRPQNVNKVPLFPVGPNQEGAGFDGYGVDGKDKLSQDRQEGNRKGLCIGGWGLKDLMISALSAKWFVRQIHHFGLGPGDLFKGPGLDATWLAREEAMIGVDV